MRYLLLSFLIFLTACNVNPHYDSIQTYFYTKQISDISVESLPHCHGYGCKFKQNISLTKKEWDTIKKPLKRNAYSPYKERKNLAKSLQLFEKIVGEKAGTSVDVADTFDKLGDFQLDCADESTNNTAYMYLLEQNGYLKHHIVQVPDIRGISGGSFWLHETAVIKEIKSGELYAVDSWWRDNGEKPYIVPLQEWKNGWNPNKS